MVKFDRNKSIYECHKKGISQIEIGKIFNLSQSSVSEIVIAMKNGATPNEIEPRGAKSKLTNAQKTELSSILKKSPTEHGYFVWDKWSIQALIKQQFEVDYAENYIFYLMRCINFSSQKPKKKDYRQKPEKVADFKENKVPFIQEKIDSDDRRLTFQDEAAVRLVPCIRSTYAPVGETPELKCDAKNKAFVSISGAISPDGYSYFEVREKEGFKQQGLTRFLDNLWADSQDNLLVVWDGASSHKSKTVKSYLAKQNEEKPRIWLENTPPYSPELNPIEQAWGWIKREMANQFYKTTKELKIAVTKKLDELKENKSLIKSFFKHKALACYQFSS